MAKLTPFIIFFTMMCSSSTSIADTTLKLNYGISTLCMGNHTIDNMNFVYNNFVYNNNVRTILSTLSSEASHDPQYSFFSNATYGKVPNKLYGYYSCRADLNSKLCRNCVHKVAQHLQEHDVYFECFGFGEFEAEDQCLVWYGNHSITYWEHYVLELGQIGAKVTNYKEYNQTLSNAIEGLIREAAVEKWSRPKFETRVVGVTGSSSHEKIYILVQCNPDISPKNCSRCIEDMHSVIPVCCRGTQGAKIVHANCFLKYNNQSFFGSAYRGFMPTYLHVLLVVLSMFFLGCM